MFCVKIACLGIVLTIYISDRERLITIRLQCRKRCEVSVGDDNSVVETTCGDNRGKIVTVGKYNGEKRLT